MNDNELGELIDHFDSLLPECDDECLNKIKRIARSKRQEMINQGKLVLISRGMLRRLRSSLNNEDEMDGMGRC